VAKVGLPRMPAAMKILASTENFCGLTQLEAARDVTIPSE
jgi:hypothetical protein